MFFVDCFVLRDCTSTDPVHVQSVAYVHVRVDEVSVLVVGKDGESLVVQAFEVADAVVVTIARYIGLAAERRVVHQPLHAAILHRADADASSVWRQLA